MYHKERVSSIVSLYLTYIVQQNTENIKKDSYSYYPISKKTLPYLFS